jgi:hypothetical protein
MDIRKRFFGLAADRDEEWRVNVDIQALLERLLLFDTFILQSIRLHEIHTLVEQFGAAAVLRLLEDDGLEIYCDGVFTAVETQDAALELLPAGRIRVAPLTFAIVTVDQAAIITEGLRRLEGLRLARRHVERLKEVVALKILPRAEDAGQPAFSQVKRDVVQHATIHRAAAGLVSKRFDSKILTDLIEIEFRPIGGSQFEAISNIGSMVKTAEDGAAIVVSAASAVADMNNRLEKMNRFSCTVGTREEEMPIFEAKFAAAASATDPDAQKRRFDRVLEAADLPALDPRKVDLERFIEIRHSRECREFRDWLWTVDEFSEGELRERVRVLRHRIGDIAQSGVGKTFRWAVSTAIGMIPVVGTLAGAGAGLLDSFVVDKLLPQAGVVTFLGRQYPSMFTEH